MSRIPAIIATFDSDEPDAGACIVVVGIDVDTAREMEQSLSARYGIPICTGYLTDDVTVYHDGDTCPIHEAGHDKEAMERAAEVLRERHASDPNVRVEVVDDHDPMVFVWAAPDADDPWLVYGPEDCAKLLA